MRRCAGMNWSVLSLSSGAHSLRHLLLLTAACTFVDCSCNDVETEPCEDPTAFGEVKVVDKALGSGSITADLTQTTFVRLATAATLGGPVEVECIDDQGEPQDKPFVGPTAASTGTVVAPGADGKFDIVQRELSEETGKTSIIARAFNCKDGFGPARLLLEEGVEGLSLVSATYVGSDLMFSVVRGMTLLVGIEKNGVVTLVDLGPAPTDISALSNASGGSAMSYISVGRLKVALIDAAGASKEVDVGDGDAQSSVCWDGKAWSTTWNFAGDVYFARISAGGAVETAAKRISDGAGVSLYPRVGCGGDRVAIAWAHLPTAKNSVQFAELKLDGSFSLEPFDIEPAGADLVGTISIGRPGRTWLSWLKLKGNGQEQRFVSSLDSECD